MPKAPSSAATAVGRGRDGQRGERKMNKNGKAWNVVSTLLIFLIVGGMFVFVAMWSTLPILSLTTDWAWAKDLTALFWELGLYK